MVAWVVNDRLYPRRTPPCCFPCPIPILELTPRSSLKKSPLSFHSLMWSSFYNPFVFNFFRTLLHNGRLSTLLRSIRYALFSSRRGVYTFPRFFSAHHPLPARHSFWLQRRERRCHEPRER